MYEIIIGAGVIILTQLIKNKVYPKYGSTGVHVLTFILAVIGVGIYQYSLYDPSFAEILQQALAFLATSITVYEVILKRIGFKSAKD